MACARGALIGVVVRPGRSRPPSSWFCQANIVWNIGSYPRLRGGRAISTTCSNGKSSWACASSTRVLTRSRSSPTEGPPERSSRSRQAVDEETDQRLDLDPPAVGDGRADHQVFLAGQSGQKRRPASEYRHEERRPAAQAERLERGREPLVELHRRGRAGVVLPRRTRAIARQVQNRRRARQRAPPVVAVRLEIDSGEPVALPDRVIRILDRQGPQ